jgi:DNA sulfur modification protein DndB
MLDNVVTVNNLRGLARTKGRDYVTKTVHPSRVEENIAAGWIVDKRNSKSVRLRRAKERDEILQDRIWSLLYRMEFTHLSDERGSVLKMDSTKLDDSMKTFSVFGIDTEIAVAIDCKSSDNFAKRIQIQGDIDELRLLREKISNSVNNQYSTSFKRQIAIAILCQILLYQTRIVQKQDSLI